jgi:hypothetical protein
MNISDTYFISIPKPCKEDWDVMTPSDKGRHCALCKKEVMDFSDAGIEKVKNVLDESHGIVCGRVKLSQIAAENFSFQLSNMAMVQLKRFALSLLLVFGSFLFTIDSLEAAEFLHKTKLDMIFNDSVVIVKGRIQDKGNKEGIAFSNILLSENDIVIARTVADIDGYFKIAVKRTAFSDKRNLVLKAASVGYKVVEIRNFMNDSESLIITVDAILFDPVIMGAMIITTVCEPQMDPLYPGHKTITRDQWNNMPK